MNANGGKHWQPSNYIVAIPAHNEEARIEACLAALCVQRDGAGAPITEGAFEILVFANNCTDATAHRTETFATTAPHPIIVISEDVAAASLNAGHARKRALDLAAARLRERDTSGGILLTTDADSCVGPTWFAATQREFQRGADCVAGYIDAVPSEMMKLGSAFIRRGRAEDRYLRAVAEIYALCDPRPHDPWPNHRVSSGASLALTLAAYVTIGGLPLRAVGEDAALTQELERMGFKVRHSMEVCVATSCRLDGRAQGGAADTMRQRHITPDAPCDAELEQAFAVARRALTRGALRRLWDDTGALFLALTSRLAVPTEKADRLLMERHDIGFEACWQNLCRLSLAFKPPTKLLRPSDLARQTVRAEIILRELRRANRAMRTAPGDRHRPAEPSGSAGS